MTVESWQKSVGWQNQQSTVQNKKQTAQRLWVWIWGNMTEVLYSTVNSMCPMNLKSDLSSWCFYQLISSTRVHRHLRSKVTLMWKVFFRNAFIFSWLISRCLFKTEKDQEWVYIGADTHLKLNHPHWGGFAQ